MFSKQVTTIIALFISFTIMAQKHTPTKSDGKILFLSEKEVLDTHSTSHFKMFGKYAKGYNEFILKAIDQVQSTAPNGNGYFIGLKANPPECPIGYELKLFENPLLQPTRKSSYCSGSTYTAFIEALNFMFAKSKAKLSAERLEAFRMQEPDNSRREDGVKFWGKWNDDGFGNHFSLVQYSKIAEPVSPEEARPGDFMNISWKSGNGHSVIFLGWYNDKNGKKYVYYWSSQPKTNGLGNELAELEKIKEVMIVRIKHPENIFNFDITAIVDKSIKGVSVQPIFEAK